MKKELAIISAVFISGCASVPYHVPKEGVDSAKLRLTSVPSNNNFVTAANPKGCVSDEALPLITVLGVKANLVRSLSRIDMPLYNSSIPDSHQNEVHIPASAPLSFQFNGVGIAGFTPGEPDGKQGALYSWCRKVVTFTPAKDRNYEALYDYTEAPNGRETCGVKLFEIVKGVDGNYSKIEVKDYKVEHNYCS
ncbi:hypothetical protein KJI95_00035 [Shewanella sp. JM162201]|uniref:Lipoprotein n=1 Tax=Shewanella jiangmenensis TaxID=2837387 RepID=A0ABS5UZJ7_9GAMM|nr:hypothetical protein [Shewanella jiangmenensis]MBT1442916.1 hypothetical protein [Shewanella jiangmenensis]